MHIYIHTVHDCIHTYIYKYTHKVISGKVEELKCTKMIVYFVSKRQCICSVSSYSCLFTGLHKWRDL